MLHLVTYKLNGINTMLRRSWRSRKVLMSTSIDGGVMLGAARNKSWSRVATQIVGNSIINQKGALNETAKCRMVHNDIAQGIQHKAK